MVNSNVKICKVDVSSKLGCCPCFHGLAKTCPVLKVGSKFIENSSRYAKVDLKRTEIFFQGFKGCLKGLQILPSTRWFQKSLCLAKSFNILAI